MGKSRSAFICLDCKQDTGKMYEFYMVHDLIWLSVVPRLDSGMLCIGCLENRLGRKLNKHDFTKYPINDPYVYKKSQRCMKRLTN